MELIRDYLDNKGIKLILIWDQDNVFQKNKANCEENNIKFLSSIRDSRFFHFTLISASNNNEGFQNLNEKTGSKILETNQGFSKQDSITFIEILKTKNKINFEIDAEVLFDLTNGNGYQLSAFMQAKGNTFQEKLQKFTEKISGELNEKVMEFFILKLKELTELQWRIIFIDILKFIDQEIKFPQELIMDKNFTYVDENGYLKSTMQFGKKYFCKLLFRSSS